MRAYHGMDAMQRVGINKLKEVVSSIPAKSGVSVHYTNHCLLATAMTRMFNQGVPEKLIAEKSGHRSLEALRCYEHTSVAQERAAGEKIANPQKVFSVPSEKQYQTPLVKEEPSVALTLPAFSGLWKIAQ